MTTPFLTTSGGARALMDLYPELDGRGDRRRTPDTVPAPSRPVPRAHVTSSRVATAFAVVGVVLLLGAVG